MAETSVPRRNERRRTLIYQEAEITPGNRAQWRIVRGRASTLITDVPAFVDFHSSIRRCLWRSPTGPVETSARPSAHLSASTLYPRERREADKQALCIGATIKQCPLCHVSDTERYRGEP